MALNYIEEPEDKEMKAKKAKVKKQKELDLGVINEIAETNSAPDAKVKIQAYAKECGFKVSKSNISVDDMIAKLLEMADAKENEKLDMVPGDKVKTPNVSTDVTSLEELEEIELPKFPIEDLDKSMGVPGLTDSFVEQMNDIVEMDIKADIGDAEPWFKPTWFKPKLDLAPGAVIPISDLPDEIRNDIIDNIKSGKLSIDAPIKPIDIVTDEVEPLIGFTPRINLIGAVGRQYMNCPYWILDWILENGPSWKSSIDKHHRESDKPILKTVLYYIQIHGSVTVRESRNSRFHTLY